MNISEAFELLKLDRYASIEEIKIAWSKQARLHHPDKGGDKDLFIKYHEAYKKALKNVKPPKCKTCDGTGWVVTYMGFKPIKRPCKKCQNK